MPASVRRDHFVAGATPAELYAVVTDFPAYPRLFPELKSVRVLERDGQRVRAEFRAHVLVAARYVLELLCDPDLHTVAWTFVEGEVVTGSEGSWRFRSEAGGTWVEYAAALQVSAPLPAFLLGRITEILMSASIPAMFGALEREVAARRAKG